MSMKVLLDMNLPPILADLLVERQVCALHWYKIGAHDASDAEIMTYAHNNRYVIITCDMDFNTILSATHSQKPSVVQIRMSIIQPRQVADLLVAALSQSADELDKGAILSLDTKKARIRLLPL